MINKAMYSSDKTCWETPQSLFDSLNREFHFTLDAAADDNNHKCDRYFTIKDNGLEQEWSGHTVFCNPPYGSLATGLWTKKCAEEAQKANTTVVLLIPARTDRASFHKYIYNNPNAEIRFLPGRCKFELHGEPMKDKKGKPCSAPFPSMIVIFRNKQLEKANVNSL